MHESSVDIVFLHCFWYFNRAEKEENFYSNENYARKNTN